MKRFLFSLLLLVISVFVHAQNNNQGGNSIITSQKIVVKNDEYPNGRPAIYLIPIVSKKYPELRKALSDTILFEGEKLDTVIKEYKEERMGFSSFSYEITFLNKNVISLKLSYEYEGAYSSEFEKWLTLSIHTGKVYPLNKEISQNHLKSIYKNYKFVLRKRILENNDDDTGCNRVYSELKTSIDNLKSSVLFKNYLFSKEGLMISMEKILPHVTQNCEPDRELLIPFSKLRPFKVSTASVIK